MMFANAEAYAEKINRRGTLPFYHTQTHRHTDRHT